MRHIMLLLAVLLTTFSTVNVLLAENVEQESLVSCRRSKEKPPESSESRSPQT
ncbi:hypothetical protein [Chlorogloeopsis sp. ULAP02]|uniref:hypothetical protein n=1 Tax=Chlorogloeopsis sp. ULAP02 TaxID=3107926 RepID=UPI003135D47E